MASSTRSNRTLHAATDAVVEFALISLQERFLRWTMGVNLRVAELAWNAGGVGIEASVASAPDPLLGEMMRTLARARRMRWRDLKFMVMDLDARTRGDDIVFTFKLTWDDGESRTPCEIEVDCRTLGPAQQN